MFNFLFIKSVIIQSYLVYMDIIHYDTLDSGGYFGLFQNIADYGEIASK